MKPLYRLEGVTYSLRGSLHMHEESMILRRYSLLIRDDTPFSPSENLFLFKVIIMFEDCDTSTVPRLKSTLDDWQHMNVSVTVGSLVIQRFKILIVLVHSSYVSNSVPSNPGRVGKV